MPSSNSMESLTFDLNNRNERKRYVLGDNCVKRSKNYRQHFLLEKGSEYNNNVRKRDHLYETSAFETLRMKHCIVLYIS